MIKRDKVPRDYSTLRTDTQSSLPGLPSVGVEQVFVVAHAY